MSVVGIDNQLRRSDSGQIDLWIVDENDLSEARAIFTEFTSDSGHTKYQEARSLAVKKREQEQAAELEHRNRTYDRKRLWPGSGFMALGPITKGCIGISVAVSLLSGLGSNPGSIEALFISEYVVTTNNWLARILVGLPEIRHGQIWRLVTPIFIHFGILHLIFNLMWLKDLGAVIEYARGGLVYTLMILVIAAASNFCQFAVNGPLFGGMSGVVYGLFGYVWMKGKFDPGSGMVLHPSTINGMIIWYVLCLTGIVGLVANTAHTVGLVVGMVWGLTEAKLAK